MEATKEAVEKERVVSGGIADEIKAIENRNTECAKALTDLEKTIASERTTLQGQLKHAKETMTIEKTNATKDLAAMKDKAQQATGGQFLRRKGWVGKLSCLEGQGPTWH